MALTIMQSLQSPNNSGIPCTGLKSNRCPARNPFNDIAHALRKWYMEITRNGLTFKALGLGALLGFLLCPVNILFGLKVGRVVPFAMPLMIATKALFPSLTISEHLVAIIVAGTTSIIAMPAGLIGVIPALQYLVLPEEGAPLQLGWHQLVPWSLGLCLPGPFLATVLWETIIVRGNLPFKLAETIASQIASCHLGNDMFSSHPRPQEPEDRTASQQDVGDPEQVHIDTGGQRRELMTLVRNLIYPILAAGIFVTLATFIPRLSRVILPGVAGIGLIATPDVALSMVFGALFRWVLLPFLACNMGWLNYANDGQQNASSVWVVLPALAALFGDASTPGLIFVLSKLYNLISEAWRYMLPSLAPLDDNQSHLVDETTPLRSGIRASSTYSGESQAIDAHGSRGFHGPTSDGQSVTYSAIIAFVVSLALHSILISFSTGKLMPLNAIIVSIVIALFVSLISVQIVGQTNYNPVSALGKISQFFFVLLYTGPLHSPVQTALIVGAVTEAFACMTADLMLDYKIAWKLGLSSTVVLIAQLIGASLGSVLGPFWYAVLNCMMDAMPDRPPFQMPSAKLWIASARVAVEREVPKEVLLFSVGIAGVFFLIALSRRSFARLSWLPDGASFALGMYNDPIPTGVWAAGGISRFGIVKLVRANGEQKAMLWGSGLMIGDSMTQLLRDVVYSFFEG